ncbi:MAG: cytochrome P450 [Syntrophothermus sp.]
MSTSSSAAFRSRIPGPSPVPILGWLPFLLRFGRAPLATLEYLHNQYGDLIQLGIDKYSAIVVFHPEYNRQILRDPASFYSYDLDLVPVPFPKDSAIRHVTNGLPLMNGPRHDDHRAELLPYFHKKFISRYYESSVEVTERKIASWRIGTELDMRSEMEQLSIWLATAPVLGLDPQKEGEAVGRQLERTMKLLLNPATLLFPYDLPGLPFHALLRAAEEMERLTLQVIARRKEAGLTDSDILSVMIRMHEEDPQRMSLNELVGHTGIMFRGGYNPNGMALYWTILLLSRHPDVLRRLIDELNGNIPTLEVLDKLPYLEAVIKEGMRLFPAGTWTGRLAMRDFELDSHPLPKGTWIVMSPYITQRIPGLFPEPYCFMPERWLANHYSSYEFMPFSAGPRYCIGASLAMMQLKIALSILVQRFSFTLKPGTQVDCVGLNSIRPKNGLPMIVNAAGAPTARVPFKGNIHKIVQLS